MTTSNRFLLLSVLFSLASISAQASQSPSFPDEIARLAVLGTLWGQVEYFHPNLALDTSIDWDEALTQAIPKVRAAATTSEFIAALQAMLDRLEDPRTRIAGLSPTSPSDSFLSQKFGYSSTQDDVLVVTIGNYYGLFDPDSQEKIKDLANMIPEASAVVFDLRSPQATDEYARLQMTGTLAELQRNLIAEPIQTPGSWRRVYYGLEVSSSFSSGQYRTGIFVESGGHLLPTDSSKQVPCVFLVNENSGLPGAAVALQKAGSAQIIYHGDLASQTVDATLSIPVTDDVTAEIRDSFPVFADATSGEFQPDRVVSSPATSSSDPAMDNALDLARDFSPSQVDHRRLASSILQRVPSSYEEMDFPSVEFRILAAVRLWNVIQHFYPYKRLLDHDWNQVLEEILPEFIEAASAREYALAVSHLAVKIQDSHAYVAGPAYTDLVVGAGYPPIRVRLIEGTPVVTGFRDPEAVEASGIKIGDVVVQVDGEAVADVWTRTGQYFSASTPQSHADKISLSLLNGPIGSEVTLLLRGKDGQSKEARLERRFEDYTTLYHFERGTEVYRLVDDKTGYVDLDRLTWDLLEPMYELLGDTDALIFDMRGYPHGVIWALAPLLTDSPKVAARFRTPMPGHRSPAPSSETFEQTFEPEEPRYVGRIVMLMDERTMSQAEHTGLYLKAATNTVFVGTHTAGANGEITSTQLPGGLTVGFTGQEVVYPDGSQLQRFGLTPDIEVKPTIRGIQDGRDEVLEAALAYLANEVP